jgi:hypothetical protein
MAIVVAILGMLTAGLCALLLGRGYLGSRQRLLLWSALCFFGLAVANGLLVADLAQASVELHRLRLGTAALSMLLLLYGLVWESGKP